MKKLNYSVEINASKEKVWKTMIEPETYKQWAKAFSPDSQYKGEWKEGEHIIFFDPNMGGTKALMEEVRPYDYILSKHVSLVNKELTSEDTESDAAKSWIGSTEAYSFKEESEATKYSVEVNTHEGFVKMFEDSFPKALELLKGLCE